LLPSLSSVEEKKRFGAPRFDVVQGKLIPAHEFLAITPQSALFVQSVVEIISAFPRRVF
jgi:hypothetical protein